MTAPAKPPFKLALAALLLDGPARTTGEMETAVAALYPGETFCTPKLVASCLATFQSIGIVRAEEGRPQRWSLTPEGRQKVLRSL